MKPELQAQSPRPTVAILVGDAVYRKMLADDINAPLKKIAEVRRVSPDRFGEDSWLAAVLGESAIIRGWHSPRLDAKLFDAEMELEFVAHTGASIQAIIPYDAIESGRIRVSNAALHIAEAVTEFAIAQILEHLRFTTRQDSETKAGTDWAQSRERFVGRLLGGRLSA